MLDVGDCLRLQVTRVPHRGVAEVYGAGASLAGREEIAAMAAEVAEQDPSQQVAAAQVYYAEASHAETAWK